MEILEGGSLDTADLRRWIGREITAQEDVSWELAQRFQMTLNRPPYGSMVAAPAPRLVHFCIAQPFTPTAQLQPDGHPMRGNFLPPVSLPRRMWAGGSIRFFDEIRIYDRVRRKSRISDVAIKEGRTGALCFVTVQHEIVVEESKMLEEKQVIVYRGEASNRDVTAPPPIAQTGAHQRQIEVTETLLFRYSALTFNAHRIHYDRRYATQTEGYPGLVVHGPLQATLLINFASDICGRPPATFSFRSQTPAFDGAPLYLHAEDIDGVTLKLWSSHLDGPVAMIAEATW